MKFVENLKDCYNELVYKVSWPSKQELSSSAVVVLSASLIMSLIVFALDSAFENAMLFFYGLF